MEVQVDTTDEANKIVEPEIKTTSKQFMSRVSCQEDMEKVEIKIQLHGHKFKAENLDVQVINDDVLFIKAEDDEEKFEGLIKLPSNVLINKIQSKFDIKEEKTQTLYFNLPKDMKVSTHKKYTISSGGNDCTSFLDWKILSSYLCFVYCDCELQMPGNRATCCYRKGK